MSFLPLGGCFIRYMNFMFDLEDASTDGTIDAGEFAEVCSCYGTAKAECEQAFAKMSKVRTSSSFTQSRPTQWALYLFGCNFENKNLIRFVLIPLFILLFHFLRCCTTSTVPPDLHKCPRPTKITIIMCTGTRGGHPRAVCRAVEGVLLHRGRERGRKFHFWQFEVLSSELRHRTI